MPVRVGHKDAASRAKARRPPRAGGATLRVGRQVSDYMAKSGLRLIGYDNRREGLTLKWRSMAMMTADKRSLQFLLPFPNRHSKPKHGPVPITAVGSLQSEVVPMSMIS